MKLAEIPTRMTTPWGNAADPSYIRTVPVPSQVGVIDGAASFATGYPPLCFQPIESGGIPPFGQDTNGVLNAITAWLRWAQAGEPMQYNSAFSTAIGGYPKGALIQSTTIGIFWLNAADDNTTDPDGGSPANWMKCFLGNYYAQDVGASANVYSCAFTPPLTSHQIGMLIRVRIGHTNTGGSTFDPTNTSTPKTIKTTFGNDLLPGHLQAPQIATFVFDGTYYQLINPTLNFTGTTNVIPTFAGTPGVAGTFVVSDGSGNLTQGPFYRTSGTIGSLAPGVPSTILTATSPVGGLSSNFWFVGAAVSGPGSAVATVCDIDGHWVIAHQSWGGLTQITFSGPSASLQVTHNYGGNSPVPWFAFRMY